MIADIVGFDKKDLPMLEAAEQAGLGAVRPEQIAVCGEKTEAVRAKGFRPAAGGGMIALIPEFILRRVRDIVSVRPRVIRKKCTRCGECVAICPAGAVTLSQKRAIIDDRPCIRCLCCQEICPNAAIRPCRSLAGGIIHVVGRIVFRR